MKTVTSVVLVGIGGQGVLKASDVVARAAFLAGFDVKKSEIHGMSQRGGGVASTVRFGEKVFSPLAPGASVGVMIALDREEGEKYLGTLAPGARVFFQEEALVQALATPRTANIALLGIAASGLDLSDEIWEKAISRELEAKYVLMNTEAFRMGREFSRGKGAKG